MLDEEGCVTIGAGFAFCRDGRSPRSDDEVDVDVDVSGRVDGPASAAFFSTLALTSVPCADVLCSTGAPGVVSAFAGCSAGTLVTDVP